MIASFLNWLRRLRGVFGRTRNAKAPADHCPPEPTPRTLPAAKVTIFVADRPCTLQAIELTNHSDGETCVSLCVTTAATLARTNGGWDLYNSRFPLRLEPRSITNVRMPGTVPLDKNDSVSASCNCAGVVEYEVKIA